jgi:hypothetical protein
VQWAAIQYAAAARALVTDELDPEIKWARLREPLGDIAHLHRVQLSAQRVDQGEYWIRREEFKD